MRTTCGPQIWFWIFGRIWSKERRINLTFSPKRLPEFASTHHALILTVISSSSLCPAGEPHRSISFPVCWINHETYFYFPAKGQCWTFSDITTFHLQYLLEKVFSIRWTRCLDIFLLFSFSSYSWHFFFLVLDKTVVSLSFPTAWTSLIALTLKEVSSIIVFFL